MTVEMKNRDVSLRAPEVRTFPALEIRDVDGTESGTFLEGRAVPYNRWADIGWFMEQHAPASFAKSIREAASQLPLLLWHDNRTFPVGVSHEWRDNDDGLDVVWKIDVEDPKAVEGARKAKDGLLTGLSIGFSPISTPSERDGTLKVDENGLEWITWTESRLLEVSLTPTPAYAGARVSLVRSRHHAGTEPGPRRSAELESWRNYRESIRRESTTKGIQ